MLAGPTLSPGALVGGRYRVTGVLASGGMGAVYEATDERLDRPVALKVILPELVADATLVARFEREARAAARLSHPGIVQVFDHGTTEQGMGYLVMERVAGETVGAILKREDRLAPRRAADLVEQALGALACAHAAGIVHRDLKPGNLMVVPLGSGRELVKVLDFGIARLAEGEAYARLTRTGVILGTPAFMAPEQARGGSVDARTDVYAMGVILWCLLTGRRPFTGPDMAAIVEALQSETPPRADVIAPTTPRALATIAETAMQKDPAARFATSEAMALALAELRATERDAPHTTPEGPSSHAVTAGRAIATEATPATALERPRPAVRVETAPAAGAPGPPPVGLAPALPRRPAGEPTVGGIVARERGGLRIHPAWLAAVVALSVVGACGLGGLLAVPAYLHFTALGASVAPAPAGNASGPSPPSAGADPAARAGRATATDPAVIESCTRTARCCEALQTRMGNSVQSCHYFWEHPDYMTVASCDETRANYRRAVAGLGGDTTACEP